MNEYICGIAGEDINDDRPMGALIAALDSAAIAAGIERLELCDYVVQDNEDSYALVHSSETGRFVLDLPCTHADIADALAECAEAMHYVINR